MNNSSNLLTVPYDPSEKEIRAYAHYLYQQSGHTPGQDLANWLEAAAYLKANIPSKRAEPS